MPLYLLDRNIIIDIRKFFEAGGTEDLTPASPTQPLGGAGRDIRESAWKANAVRARSVDAPENFVSPLLSVLEGKVAGNQSRDQMLERVLQESKLVKDFFKQAGTDADFLTQDPVAFVEPFLEQARKDAEKCGPLLKVYLQRLARDVSPDARIDQLDWALSTAISEGVEIAHPIVMAAIATVFGNRDAKRVLKPKLDPEKVDSRLVYGAQTDLLNISWLNYVRHIATGMAVEFLTADGHLERFMACSRLRVTAGVENAAEKSYTTQTAVDIDWPRLLPSIAEEEEALESAKSRFILRFEQQQAIRGAAQK